MTVKKEKKNDIKVESIFRCAALCTACGINDKPSKVRVYNETSKKFIYDFETNYAIPTYHFQKVFT